ncbi:MAG TPA: quinoprotein dehydrogenase-associated putative ABC transporter substrate-binding protein [Rhodocyclaceae bacterium]|nr:quinoprotein dehydrogenase-associated putative ABC transporter substrate-binding protein [Rhodocyclaceae bacterium]
MTEARLPINTDRVDLRRLTAGAALACATAALLATAPAVQAGEGKAGGRDAVRVCQDPNNLPFANDKEQGFENRIAELLGKYLGVPVTYFNYPQRFVFIRNTLRYKLPGEDYPCDVIIGLPVGFDQVAVTKPYYRSTYAMIFAQGKGLDDVNSVDDFLALGPERLSKLRIGLYDKSPVSQWMDRHNLVDQGVPYQTINVAMDHYVGDIIDKDLAGGKLDVAIVWGPVAGYYASKFNPPMKVVPMKSEPGIQFDFAFGMGIRRGEPEWKAQLEGFLDTHEAEIAEILKAYHVPLVEGEPKVVSN